MNDAVLQAFRDTADSMQTQPADWQWVGPHMSQRMFGITQERAEGYARSHGGKAEQMPEPSVRDISESLARINRAISQ